MTYRIYTLHVEHPDDGDDVDQHVINAVGNLAERLDNGALGWAVELHVHGDDERTLVVYESEGESA